MSTDAVKIRLAFPVELDGEALTTLQLRPLTPEDLAWSARQRCDNRVRGLRMAERLSGVPATVLDELDLVDRASVIDAMKQAIAELSDGR